MKKLKVHYFQHIAGEGFGSCYEYLKQQGAEISATEFFALPKDGGVSKSMLKKSRLDFDKIEKCE